jgi:Arc/MetJ-type ribon-helix-helix transcriptional regulator
MEMHPTPDQEKFIRQAIETGRLGTADDAAKEAMALWEQRERRRMEILLAVDDAEAAAARGEARTVTEESMRELAAEVGRRGRLRLAQKQQSG